MLIERTFAIGEALCLASALLLGAALALTGAIAEDPFLAISPVLFVIVGGLFLVTSRQAHADRMELLALGGSRPK